MLGRSFAVLAILTLGSASSACSHPGYDSDTQKVIDDHQRVTREDSAKRAADGAEAQRKADEKQASAATKAESEKKTAADASDQKCASSRAERVAAAKDEIHGIVAWTTANESRMRYAVAHCKPYDSRGIKVTKEKTSDGGVIVRTEPIGTPIDVKCDGAPGRPAGIDAKFAYEFRSMIEQKDNPIDQLGECAKGDQAALGTNLNVARGDRDGMNAILKLP